MPLTDLFVKNVKATKPSGEKHTDGGGMYLLVKEAGKYWRMDYRHLGTRKTLALGVYPDVSLAKARKRRDDARELQVEGLDAAQAKRDDKVAKVEAAGHTFESVARQWLDNVEAIRKARTQKKVQAWLEHDAFPISAKCPFPPSSRVTCC